MTKLEYANRIAEAAKVQDEVERHNLYNQINDEYENNTVIVSKEDLIKSLNLDSTFIITDIEPLFDYKKNEDGELIQEFKSVKLTYK